LAPGKYEFLAPLGLGLCRPALQMFALVALAAAAVKEAAAAASQCVPYTI
jgi:hypothetical protein